MDNIEDNASHPPNSHDLGQNYESSQHPTVIVQSLSNPQRNNIAEIVNIGDEDYDTEDTEDDDNNLVNEIRSNRQKKSIIIGGHDDDTTKKRKLKTLLSNYEFAPRAGRNSNTDWTEHESFVLLDAWGEKFVNNGRKSVRSEEWYEVAKKVAEGSKIKRTETQCRNRLDTMKKQYKKEKAKFAESVGYSSKWVYFKKMDMYLSPSSNPFDSESAKVESDNLDDFPPKRTRIGRDRGDGGSFKVLADSIDKFSDIFEKVEASKSKQLVELENMRIDILRDLKLQKREILERGRVEIAKIWGYDGKVNDLSPDNVSK